MKKILITGAGSYIGTSFEEYMKQWSDRYQIDTVDMIGDGWMKHDFSGYDTVYHVAGIAHSDNGKISKEKAVRILKDQDKFKDIEIASAELVIYGDRLSWNFEITHSDISFIIMDANTGDILNVAYIEAIAKN